jgi:cell division protein FtsZ
MAARAAISSPLLDISIEGARGVLFNIAGGNDLTMFEVDEAARIISSAADPDANVIFGAVIKSDLTDQVRITVIATGFDETRSRLASMSQTSVQKPIVQGVVSEVGTASENEDEDDKHGNEPPEEDGGSSGDEDVFGEKFEIPAFLRKIH